MIVYGDPEYSTAFSSALQRLREAARDETLEGLRFSAIFTGQLEQAVSDCLAKGVAPADTGVLAQVKDLTDAAARALARKYSGESPEEALSTFRGRLDSLTASSELELRVKVPEGYAFYCLYPEQYLLAAGRWAKEHPGATEIVAAGVLSIGSSLSAVVQAALEREGKRVRRLTSRPSGHPFDRRADVQETFDEHAWALVVDEGPGLSGSSMVAMAEALVRAGIAADRISFLPGHAGEPGQAASAECRMWWSRAPRYHADPTELRWDGRSLTEKLAATTSELTGERVVKVEDLGGGQWRRCAYRDPREWSPAWIPFERPKYRCVLAGGSSILWKFSGLAAADPTGRPAYEIDFERHVQLSELGWTPRPVDCALGFVATPWIEGRRMIREDVSTALLTKIGAYIESASGPPLELETARLARQRLTEMCYWNTHEALGPSAAATARERLERLEEKVWPSYGDGRMAPPEWVLTPGNRLFKTDVTGHDRDHTMVGKQPVLWDVAGACVEWRLSPAQAGSVVEVVPSLAETTDVADLTAYQLAYAAFRMGMSAQCAESVSDPAERMRLEAAEADYTAQLLRLLEG